VITVSTSSLPLRGKCQYVPNSLVPVPPEQQRSTLPENGCVRRSSHE
jgi:hypothetical protein